MINPLLETFQTPFQTPPFDKITDEHFLPAIKEAIREAKEEIEHIKSHLTPSFENTIEALERSGSRLSQVSSIFFNLNAAETTDTIQQIAKEISPLLSEYGNDILLDEQLFAQIETVFQQKDRLSLDEEQTTLLEKTVKSFIRNGAKLSPEDKTRLREIDQELSKQGLQFGENVLKETNRYELVIENQEDLKGLPPNIVEAAAQTAAEKGKEGKWIFTLAFPSYVPFITYAENRELRRELFLAYNTKCSKGDELDNCAIIQSIIRLKNERAALLGYPSYADFVLEERMASGPDNVLSFLHDLLEKSKPKAEEEINELAQFARELDGLEYLEKWDVSFYAEKLKKQKFDVDDELLKPYFELENTVQGVFATAEKLFGLVFVKNEAIPVYHPEVSAYEVQDLEGNHVAVFYTDFFPRAGKRNGAWMTSYRGQRKIGPTNQRPFVSIVCNFSRPTKSKPSLLTFNEVTTLFHEFGHALHGMLADGRYESLSGTSVFWDFVELPSQIFENWCYERECLDLFAKHYETEEKIPDALIEKLKKAANFHQGYQTVRQISFGLLDMAYHSTSPNELDDIVAFEKSRMEKTELLPPVPETLMSTSFSHIFQGGYAAGYYSYKWAEVLDADAFELFVEKGIFDPETASAFKTHILAAGGRVHPAILYRRFRGRDPKPEALLRRAGLIAAV
ncbi:MAG: M3 family metallopeptidase [Lunatimonas sp.]|uniref:M3 family metallopeptidase n=1 Tax=Lunatimonas sp. TaxID=2060141 RepID=UPI00263B1F9C|nr:M3 family metallopeptidase [Lunatimonas sp.]MCC5937030.1 M3 family metallopeptidase [Lunatimonas sp.]